MSLNTKLFKVILTAITFFEPLQLISMSYDEAKNRCENSVQNIKEIIASDPKKYNKNTADILKRIIPILESSILNMVKKKESNWIEEYFHYQDGLQAVNWLLANHENFTPLQQHQPEKNVEPRPSKEKLAPKVSVQNKKPDVIPKHKKSPAIVTLSVQKNNMQKKLKKTKIQQKIKKSQTPLKKKT
jgi:hypothetical protein